MFSVLCLTDTRRDGDCDMLYITEYRKSGNRPTGQVLFTSRTNNVDVRFTSDEDERRKGFTLDITSMACADVPNPCDDVIAQEVVVPTGEVLESALFTEWERNSFIPCMVSLLPEQCMSEVEHHGR